MYALLSTVSDAYLLLGNFFTWSDVRKGDSVSAKESISFVILYFFSFDILKEVSFPDFYILVLNLFSNFSNV